MTQSTERIEERLLKLKKGLEKTEQEIQRNEGRLSGYYDELRNSLELPESSPKKKIIQKCNQKIKEIKEQIKKNQDQLQKLMDEIEEEVQEWEE